jgi:hypothetical protein
VRAGELTPGERLKTDGGEVVVDGVRWLREPAQVYNLEVAGDHYYLVSEARVLSHNADGCGFSIDELSEAASEEGRGEMTRAGQNLQKHGDRHGSIFPKPTGSSADINQRAQDIVDDILTNPKSTTTTGTEPRFGEVIEIREPSGRGVRYSRDGKFLHFLEP